MRDEIDVAWAAGLFEGEGTIGRSSHRQPRIALAMTDEDVVTRFAAIVGRGNVRRYHYPPHKPQWQWSAQSAKDVLYVLAMLWPYLGERRQQRATELIERASRINESDGFCKNGHDLADPVHVYLHRKTGKRHCRTCNAEHARRRRLRLAS